MTVGSILLTLLVGFILLLWLAIFGGITVCSLRDRGAKRTFGVIGGLLALYGILGFMGTGAGLAAWLPSSVEWPVGWAGRTVTTPAGMHVVAHSSSGRVQVYDAQWRFRRGWHVDNGGGVFTRLAVFPDDTFEIWTARNPARYVFDLDGRRVHRPDTPSAVPVASATTQLGMTLGPWVPTWYVLLPLSHPFIAWALILAGLLLLVATDKLPIRPKHRTSATPS